MAYTPAKYALSSVFMTPESGKKPAVQTPHYSPRPLPLLSIMLSPVVVQKHSTANSTNRDTRDVLADLIDDGLPAIVESILSLLSPSDLVECMQVSQKWHQMITSMQNLMDKVSSYRTQRQSKAGKKAATHKIHYTRQALSSIPLNNQKCISNHSLSWPLPFAKHNHHRPCPHCHSPARTLNQRRVECPRCKLDFCTNCFCVWHEGECPSRSPKRPQRDGIAGTQQCKKRLRRL